MTDRPIIFSGPMVRALLNGSKTMTRRVLKLPKKTFSGGPIYERPDMGGWEPTTTGMCFDAPWQPGDRLWVREACVTIGMGHGFDVTHWPHGTCAYLADGKGEWYDRALRFDDRALRFDDRALCFDDRALHFNGSWPSPGLLLAFKPWNKREPQPETPVIDNKPELSACCAAIDALLDTALERGVPSPIWPLPSIHDWCGEHQPREAAQ